MTDDWEEDWIETEEKMHCLQILAEGQNCCGKTTQLITYTHGSLPGEYIPTIMDHTTFSVRLGSHTMNVGFRDCAGGEDYDKLRVLSYPGSDVFMVHAGAMGGFWWEGGIKNMDCEWLPKITNKLPKTPFIVCLTKSDRLEHPHSRDSHGRWLSIYTEENWSWSKVKETYEAELNQLKKSMLCRGEEHHDLYKMCAGIINTSSFTRQGVDDAMHICLCLATGNYDRIESWFAKKKPQCNIRILCAEDHAEVRQFVSSANRDWNNAPYAAGLPSTVVNLGGVPTTLRLICDNICRYITKVPVYDQETVFREKIGDESKGTYTPIGSKDAVVVAIDVRSYEEFEQTFEKFSPLCMEEPINGFVPGKTPVIFLGYNTQDWPEGFKLSPRTIPDCVEALKSVLEYHDCTVLFQDIEPFLTWGDDTEMVVCDKTMQYLVEKYNALGWVLASDEMKEGEVLNEILKLLDEKVNPEYWETDSDHWWPNPNFVQSVHKKKRKKRCIIQ